MTKSTENVIPDTVPGQCAYCGHTENAGQWTITSPDGRRWTADKVSKAAMQAMIDTRGADVVLGNIQAISAEDTMTTYTDRQKAFESAMVAAGYHEPEYERNQDRYLGFNLALDALESTSPIPGEPDGGAGFSEAAAINGIPATLRHDEGAIARCSYCGRYSLDPKTLSDRQPTCDCGERHGWSGSFINPSQDAQWHAAAPSQPAAPSDLYQFRTKPTWRSQWSEWEACSAERAADYRKSPLLHDWEYEVREFVLRDAALSTAAQGATLTDETN